MDSAYVFDSEQATKLLMKNYELVKTSGVSFIDKRIRFLIARLLREIMKSFNQKNSMK